MTGVAYVDGTFVAPEEARVSIWDRGFLFADAVYEVTTVIGGRLVDSDLHMARLQRSLDALRIESTVGPDELAGIHEDLVARNGLREGMVYLQVSRGAADRDFPFPQAVKPTVILFTREIPVLEAPAARDGIRVLTVPDNRWGRRDIKTVMLLPSVLAKQAARDAGCDDAWFVQGGTVTEGSSNNAYIVADGEVVTRPLSPEILPGCTRRSLLRLAKETGIRVVERPFAVEEAYAAEEAFITSATTLVTPVVEIDGRRIGSGRPGPLTQHLRRIYIDHATQA